MRSAMSTIPCRSPMLALSLLCMAAAAPPLAAQSPSPAPSRAGVVLRVTGAATGFGIAGAALGAWRDGYRCKQRWGSTRERDTIPAWGLSFGPCFFPIGDGANVGIVGGGIVGGAATAAHYARRRGCPARAAWTRAIAGAVIGAAPGVQLVARRPSRWPPQRTRLLLLTPALSGVGASVATLGCGRAG